VSALEAEDHAKVFIHADRPTFWLSLEWMEPQPRGVHHTGMRGAVQQTQDELKPHGVLGLALAVTSRVEELRQSLVFEAFDHAVQYNLIGYAAATRLVMTNPGHALRLPYRVCKTTRCIGAYSVAAREAAREFGARCRMTLTHIGGLNCTMFRVDEGQFTSSAATKL